MPGTADTLEFIRPTDDTNERSLGILPKEFTFPAGLMLNLEVVVVAKDAGAMFRTFGVDAISGRAVTCLIQAS